MAHGRQRRPSRKSECLESGCEACTPFHLSIFNVLALRAPTRPARERVSVAAWMGLTAIRGYQRFLSPRLSTRCPHEPSCSGYGLGALRRYGLWQGSRLTAGRLGRCYGTVPPGTPDPVP